MEGQRLHHTYLQNAFLNEREKNMPPSYLEHNYTLGFFLKKKLFLICMHNEVC